MAKAIAFLAAALLGACASNPPLERVETPSLVFLADFNLDLAGREESAADRIGGLSAITYDEITGNWFALSDARVRSRFYELSVHYDGDVLEVTPVRVIHFRTPAGRAFAESVLDPEGLAETPWGTLLVSTESDERRRPVEQPKLLEFDASGGFVRTIAIPEKFLVRGSPPRRGVRHNLGLESLTLTPDGSRLFVAGEAALLQDGPEVSFDEPVFCRILEYELSGREFRPTAEYAYPLGPVARPEGLEDVEVDSGLVELIALSSSKLLSLERDFIRERGGASRSVNRSRVFIVDVGSASDVTSVASLREPAGWTPARKGLLLDFDDVVSQLSPGFQRLDNFEAMGLGPRLPGGGRSLLVVSDDNFSDRQRSAFLLFSLKAVVE